MKVLMINGSPHKEGNTYLALKEMENIFLQEGIECEIVQVLYVYLLGCIDAVPVEKRENVFLTTASMRLRQNSRNVTDWLSEALFIMHQQTAHWFPSLTVCSSARPLIKP